MKELFEKRLEILIREYGIWKRQLKKDIETTLDITTNSKKGSIKTLEIVIQDLKKLRQLGNWK